MATRKRVVVMMVVALLLLSGAPMWGIFGSGGKSTSLPAAVAQSTGSDRIDQTTQVAASVADVDAPSAMAVVDLQEVLAAAVPMNAARLNDGPAAGPQQGKREPTQNERTRSAFSSVLAAVADLAASRGCDVVLSIRTDGGQTGPGAVRPCFLAAPLDLTDEVIAHLGAGVRNLEQPLPMPTTRPAGHAAVASVDTARLFNQMRHTRELRAKANERRQVLAQETMEQRDKLTTLKQQRDQAVQGSPERKGLDAKLLDAAVAHEAWGKAAEREIDRDQKAGMKAIFQEIAAAAAELGRRRGCWLVLVAARPDIPQNLAMLQPDQLRSLIGSTTVLYSASQADLTNELLQILDAQYAGQAVPWPAMQPGPAAPLPLRIIDQAAVTRRAGLSASQFTAAVSQLARQRGYTLVLPENRPKLPDSVDGIDMGTLRNLINSCNVLYADPAADIGAELAPEPKAK